MQNRAWLVIGLALTLSIAGCAKKTAEISGTQGTGFDSISTTDELAQLPQVSALNQQAAVEALPVETSPVTQGAPMAAAPAAPAAPTAVPVPASAGTGTVSLSHDKKIQTALKNAGYYQGNIDGKIGPASKRAVEAFQKEKGLKVDGKVGPKTWAALEPYLNDTPQAAAAENTADTATQ